MFLDLLEMITSIPAKLASSDFAVGNYLIKVNIKKKKKNRTINEICSKFTIKISEQLHWRRSGVLVVNFEQIPFIVLVFSSLMFSYVDGLNVAKLQLPGLSKVI